MVLSNINKHLEPQREQHRDHTYPSGNSDTTKTGNARFLHRGLIRTITLERKRDIIAPERLHITQQHLPLGSRAKSLGRARFTARTPVVHNV